MSIEDGSKLNLFIEDLPNRGKDIFEGSGTISLSRDCAFPEPNLIVVNPELGLLYLINLLGAGRTSRFLDTLSLSLDTLVTGTKTVS